MGWLREEYNLNSYSLYYWASSHKDTHNGVYIHLMCKGTNVGREYKFNGVSPILNGFGNGKSKMCPTYLWGTKSYLSLHCQHTN